MTQEEQRQPLLVWGFALAAAAPFLVVLLSLVTQTWSWGLMDDHSLLAIRGGVIAKWLSYFRQILANGALRPVTTFHAALAYKVFENAPGLFHLFRFVEVAAAVGVWAWAAFQLTGKRWTVFLMIAAAMSFHYIYDAFFFLSTQEILGVFFTGVSLLLVQRSFYRIFSGEPGVSWGCFGCGILSYVLALGCKEPFIAFGLALGIGMMLLSSRVKGIDRGRILIAGALLVVLSLLYGVFIKVCVTAPYTAAYSFTDVAKITGNLLQWARKDLLNHAPWIVAALLLGRKALPEGFSLREQWGFVFGVLYYIIFLLLILPWSAVVYLATPLGVIFAFVITICVARSLEKSASSAAGWVMVMALVINIAVAGYATTREMIYHLDTQNLLVWASVHPDFQEASRQGRVFSNAPEPSVAIPSHANRRWGLNMANFQNGEFSRQGSPSEYFVYSSRFGGFPAAALKSWRAAFYGKYWQVYERQQVPPQ